MLTVQELIDFEQRVADLWEKGAIRVPVHLSGGNEEQLIKIFQEDVRLSDYVLCSHRNHYHALLHGVNKDTLLRNMLEGKAGGSMAFCAPAKKFYSSGIVGGLVAFGVGLAYGIKESGRRDWVHCFVGDGVLDGGHFWESLQYAEGWDLPITFVVEHNNRSTCTSVEGRLGPTGGIRGTLAWSKLVKVYTYKATWPHVGTGTYVQF